MESLQKLKVAELREALKERGLDSTGTKQVLLERLQAAMATETVQEEPAAAEPQEVATEAAEEPAAEAAADPAAATNGTAATAVGAEKPVAEMTDEERRLARAKRFGIVTKEVVQEKKRARAERFGIPPTDEERKAERAKRFGLEAATKATAAANKSNSKEFQEKLKARKAKFGEAAAKPAAPVSAEFEAKKKARAERFKS